MGDPVGGEGIGQRADHRILADQRIEGLRPVFAREHAIGPAVRRGRVQLQFERVRRACVRTLGVFLGHQGFPKVGG